MERRDKKVKSNLPKVKVKEPKVSWHIAKDWCYHNTNKTWQRDFDEFSFEDEIDYCYFMNFLDRYNLID